MRRQPVLLELINPVHEEEGRLFTGEPFLEAYAACRHRNTRRAED